MSGHLNLLLATGLMPWLAWCLVPAFRPTPRVWKWLLAAGTIWAAMIWCSLYFIWVGAIVAGCWAIASVFDKRLGVQVALLRCIVMALTALLLGGPIIVWFWQAKAAEAVTFDTADQLAYLGASINTLPIPSVYHPVFRDFIAA